MLVESMITILVRHTHTHTQSTVPSVTLWKLEKRQRDRLVDRRLRKLVVKLSYSQFIILEHPLTESSTESVDGKQFKFHLIYAFCV